MRIAQVVASYHPQIGGVETHVRQLATAFASAGDEVTVLTHQTGGDEPAEELHESVRILRFPLTVRSRAYPFSWALSRYLRKHTSDFDLVHAHSYHTLVGQPAARSGLPFVFTPHYHGTGGHTALSGVLHRAYRPLGCRLIDAANAIICVSAAERALLLRDFPGVPEKVSVIPNGTDPRPRAAMSSQTPAPPGEDRLILTIGRLERYKNVDLVIKALQALPEPARLVVVGDGPDRARLESLARTADPNRPVSIAGRISGQELETLLTTAAVVTSASDHEAFGLTLADGLMAGARVVASAIPAHHEIGELAGPSAPITFIDPRNTPEFTASLATALYAGRVSSGSFALPSWPDVAARTRRVYSQLHGLSTATGNKVCRIV